MVIARIFQSNRQKFIYTDDSDYAGDGSGDLIVRKRKRNSKIRTRKTQRQDRQACQIQCYNRKCFISTNFMIVRVSNGVFKTPLDLLLYVKYMMKFI